MDLMFALKVAAAIQFAISIVNFRLVQIMGWEKELERLSLLPRQVFMVHCWFISLTLIIFGVLTWQFAPEMIRSPIGRALACAIGFFWTIRTILQLVYYSSSHWNGSPFRTAVHAGTLLVYAGFSVLHWSTGLNIFTGME